MKSKDGKADNAEDKEDRAIKGRGRGKRKCKRKCKKKCKKKVFNKDKFWEVVPIYGDGNCLFRAAVSGDDETLLSCSRQGSGYPVNAKHAELKRRSAHQLRLKAVEMLRPSTSWLRVMEMTSV